MHEGLLRGDRRLQHRDVPAHRPRSDPSRQRQQQPADPLCRQPWLLAQPPDDLLPPRVQIADPRRRHPHRRRRPPYGSADRLDVQLQPPGDFLLRHLLHQMQVANLGPLRHSDHLRVLLAVSTRRPCLAPSIIARRPLSSECSGGPFSSGHGVPFHVAATTWHCRTSTGSGGTHCRNPSPGPRPRSCSSRSAIWICRYWRLSSCPGASGVTARPPATASRIRPRDARQLVGRSAPRSCGNGRRVNALRAASATLRPFG